MALARIDRVTSVSRESNLPALAAAGHQWAESHGYPGLGEEAVTALGMVMELTGSSRHLHQTVRDQAPLAVRAWALRFARDEGFQLADVDADELGRMRGEMSPTPDDPRGGKRLRAFVKTNGSRLRSEAELTPEEGPESPPERKSSRRLGTPAVRALMRQHTDESRRRDNQ